MAHTLRCILWLAFVALAAAWQEAQAAPRSRQKAYDAPFYWTAAAGNIALAGDPELFQGHLDELAMAGGMGQRLRPNLAVAVEFEFYSGRLDADPQVVLFGSVADHYVLDAGALGLALVAEVPRGKVRPFAGASGGLFMAKIVRHGTSIFFPFQGTVDDDRDLSLAFALNAGVAFQFTSKDSVTIEFRRLFARSNFPAISDESVDLGGNLILVGYRREFSFVAPSARPRP